MPPANIPFYLHHLGAAEAEAVAAVLKTPMLTTGAQVADFERDFARYLGVREVVGLTSCTDALHLALHALGLGPGDEVITTPQTFIATFHVILRVGATPVLVDVEQGTGLIGPEVVRTAITARTRAILPVHLYGRMCDMRGLGALADEHGLFIVEDAAHCVEGRRDGIRPGQAADMACFSFYATKNLTSGEGGAIALQDAERAARLRRLRGIGTAINFQALHRFTAVRRLGRWREGDFPVAERIADTALTLPFYPRLTAEQADAICDAVRATI